MSPDRRTHRGAHPEDRRLFGADAQPSLRAAVAHLSWLLSRGYPIDASLKLVGDRHRLRERQRVAARRSACSDEALALRARNRRPLEAMRGQRLAIDGFNLLVTLEAAFSGGVLLRGRDGCLRDLSSIHGSYRAVAETGRAIEHAGAIIERHPPAEVVWLLDRPVSNSGRLRARIEALAAARGWPWRVELPFNPDAALSTAPGLIVTSDSVVLDAGAPWVNLAAAVVADSAPDAWIVDLTDAAHGAGLA